MAHSGEEHDVPGPRHLEGIADRLVAVRDQEQVLVASSASLLADLSLR